MQQYLALHITRRRYGGYRWRASKTAPREYGDRVEVKGTMTLEFKDWLNRFLCGAWSVRTRSGAWLVKGIGPTRRYSTAALAEREVQRRRRARNGKAS
mgnify:CR=1 FL=1